MKLALLAGGKATRLYPKTQTIAKSMIEVVGKPFIHHQLTLLRAQAISEVVLCVGQFAEQIQAYVGNGEDFGIKVSYSIETAGLLGTGGALQQALPLLGEQFWVMYGDSYLPIAFAPIARYFAQYHSRALMTVYHNQNRYDKSNVFFHDGRVMDYNKQQITPNMQHIDYGLGILSAAAFAGWPKNGAFDLADVYQALLKQNQLLGYEVQQRFYEIGSLSGLAETEVLLAKQNCTCSPIILEDNSIVIANEVKPD